MSIVDRKFSFFLIRDSLKGYSEDSEIITNSYPFEVFLNLERHSIFVYRTHDSGDGRDNDDECRIQISRKQWDIASRQKSLFLGFHNEKQILSIWESEHILTRENPSTFSIYSRLSNLDEATKLGLSIYKFYSKILTKDTFCINFRPEFLGSVLDNIDTLWKLEEAELKQTILQIAETKREIVEKNYDLKDDPRERILITRNQFKRNPKFAQAVLSAYGHKCSFCSIQLGIIEAAHIVPHSHESASNSVSNGIALCPNHHKVFDTGLVAIGKKFRVAINQVRVDYLKEINRASGLSDILQMQDRKINLPRQEDFFPLLENIRIGNRVRGVEWD